MLFGALLLMVFGDVFPYLGTIHCAVFNGAMAATRAFRSGNAAVDADVSACRVCQGNPGSWWLMSRQLGNPLALGYHGYGAPSDDSFTVLGLAHGRDGENAGYGWVMLGQCTCSLCTCVPLHIGIEMRMYTTYIDILFIYACLRLSMPTCIFADS